MTTFVNLALKSLVHRKDTVILTVLSLTLSVFLILSVERVREAAENGFTQTISQTDLIVGARTGPTNLVLATVFNRGTFANNIKASTYEFWKNKETVDWTIPLALGDGHRGFRVVGTTEAFYEHYHYQGNQGLVLREGLWANKIQEVVIGSEVAEKLNYQLGQKVVIDHGVTRDVGMIHHDEHPFQVVGVLKPTGTIIDQSLFVSLESLEALHEPELEKAPSAKAAPADVQASVSTEAGHGEGHHEEAHHVHHGEAHSKADGPHAHKELTAFFLKLKNRVDILSLQRDINNFEGEPLSAVIPSVVVNDLWQTLSAVEKALRVLGLCILVVSLLSMISILMATLNERRREMSILRALGGSPQQLAGLLVLESSLITLAALVLGVVLQIFVVFSMQAWLKDKYGLFIGVGVPSGSELQHLLVIGVLGCLVGFLPAWRVYRSALKDGLTVK